MYHPAAMADTSLIGQFASLIEARRTTPLPQTGRSGGVTGLFARTAGNRNRQLAAGSVNSTLFAIHDRICDGVTAPRWGLERLPPEGRVEEPASPDDRELVSRHAVLDLIAAPNPVDDWTEVVGLLQNHWESTGEWNLLVVRAPDTNRGRLTDGIPTQVWPIRPDKLEPVDGPQGLQGWIYKAPDGRDIPLETGDVIRSRRPHPTVPWRGYSVVEALLADIDAMGLAAQWNRNFFRNSALPGGIVEFERRLGDVEWREFVDRWREQHQGVDQAHRVATIEGGGKWVDRRYSLRDMQFVDLRDMSREIIREGYGFPKAMLGTVDDVNRANAEANEVLFGRWLIIPRLRRLRDKLNRRLLPMYGQTARNVALFYSNPIPPDREADDRHLEAVSQAAERLWRIGYNPDDIADRYELGDLRWTPEADPKRVGSHQGPDGGSGGADKNADNTVDFVPAPTSSNGRH